MNSKAAVIIGRYLGYRAARTLHQISQHNKTRIYARHGNLNTHHSALHQPETTHHIHHFSAPAPPLLHGPKAFLRLPCPPLTTHLSDVRHPTRCPSSKVLLLKHNTQSRPRRIAARRSRKVPPDHQLVLGSPLARYLCLAHLPQPPQLRLRRVQHSVQPARDHHLRCQRASYRPRGLVGHAPRAESTAARGAHPDHAPRPGGGEYAGAA